MTVLHDLARAFDSVWWHVEAWTGTDDTAGPQYGFFSGFGSDLGEIALVGGLWHLFHQYNCHEPRCWRIGPHQYDLDGQLVKLCKKHHPAIGALKKGQVQEHYDRCPVVIDGVGHCVQRKGHPMGYHSAGPVN